MARCGSCSAWDRERNKHQVGPVAAVPGRNCSLPSGSCEGTREKKTEEQRSRGEPNRGRQITAKGALGANTSEPGSLQRAS